MKNKFLLLLISLSIFTGGCILGDNGKDKPEKVLTSYPLKIGNRWEYSWKLRFYNFREDSISISKDDLLLFSTIELEITRNEVLEDTLDTFVFHEGLTDENGVYEADTYYHENESGLYMIAYYSGSSTAMKNNAVGKVFFLGHTFNSVEELVDWVQNPFPAAKTSMDSLLFEYPWRQSLYPLKTGVKWSYHNPEGGFVFNRNVEGVEEINVPAGKFLCYKINAKFNFYEQDLDNDVTVTDYICSKGLIRRLILARDVSWGYAPGVNTEERFDSTQEILLTNIDLK